MCVCRAPLATVPLVTTPLIWSCVCAQARGSNSEVTPLLDPAQASTGVDVNSGTRGHRAQLHIQTGAHDAPPLYDAPPTYDKVEGSVVCASCGALVGSAANFCAVCGTPLRST